MSNRSPMAEKTAKARKMDIQERLYVQSRGDCADIQRGRTLMFYDTWLCGRNPKVQAEWSVAHSLTPTEQWAIRMGYLRDPLAHKCYSTPSEPPVMAAVYYDNGRRVMMRLEQARQAFATDEHVVRYISRGESAERSAE